jgi:ubiquinone/menaquinone biosynthesis C-methylase UbiE
MNLQSYFSTELVDMGELDPGLRGIWTPKSQLFAVSIGLTTQFTDHAAEYAAKYASPDYFRKLIVRGLTLNGATIGQDAHILDLGAGAGDNSVFPCLDLFKQAKIVATDLSPKLLALLRHKLGQRGVGDSVAVVCTDAMLDIFVSGSFNLVIGAAILHHLMDPSRALVTAHRALKPGGYAMFFEPFELGHSILALIFERIISEASLRSSGIDPNCLHFMHLFAQGVRRCLGRDKSAPIFGEIDDKWLFSESYFQKMGKAAGFEQVRIESIHNPKSQITDRAAALLSLGANAQLSSLPEWAQAIVGQANSAFSETRNEMIFEGIVTMRKPRWSIFQGLSIKRSWPRRPRGHLALGVESSQVPALEKGSGSVSRFLR